MNAALLLDACDGIDNQYILRAGEAAGILTQPEKPKKRRSVRVVLIAAAMLLLLTGVAFAGLEWGIWNDRWLQTPDQNPLDVVRIAIENQEQKNYTLSVAVDEIRVDEAETKSVLENSKESMLALQNGWTDQFILTAAEKNNWDASSPADHFLAVYARYTVEYDHTKTYYQDGALYQYFYLWKTEDGNWQVFDNTSPAAFRQSTESSTHLPAIANTDVQEYEGAVQAIRDMVMAWQGVGDYKAITIQEAFYNPEKTKAALKLLESSRLSDANGWTMAYLEENMAAVEIIYRIEFVFDPQLPERICSTETDTYYLLRDPATGEWANSEITGFVAASQIPESKLMLPQPGDTTATWNAELAAQYPSDVACSDLELLEKWMAVEGLSYADLAERRCRQLVLVAAQDAQDCSTITVCYAQNEDGSWYSVPEFSRMNGWTGKNGIYHNRLRDTITSPAGLWALGIAFGNAEKPKGLKLPWRSITPQSDWVCDANSIYFNTWQERNDETLLEAWDWSDAEHLEDYPEAYAYACVIAFNTPPHTIPERGCAFFLHCAKHATGGCIGLADEDMLRVLQWLDPADHPYILITGIQQSAD